MYLSATTLYLIALVFSKTVREFTFLVLLVTVPVTGLILFYQWLIH